MSNAIHARKDYDSSLSEEFDAKLSHGEPVIIFRGQDKHFVDIVEFYRERIVEDDASYQEDLLTLTPNAEAMLEGLQSFSDYAEKWQIDNATKAPDVPEGQMRLGPEFEI